MSETDTGEIVQSEAEAAIEHAYHVENDPARANALYQRLIGSTDREGEAPAPVPEAPDEAKADAPAEPAGPSPDDVDQGMGGGQMADYVPYDSLSADEQDKVFDGMLSLSDPGVSEGILKREWQGAEYEVNREFVNAALMANSHGAKVVQILEAAGGVVNHPDIIRFMAEVGRALASKPGDPATIPITTSEGKKMANMNTKQIEARIDTLQDDIERAQAVNDDVKSNRLYQEQQGLYRLLPGGGDPAIGEGGRTI